MFYRRLVLISVLAALSSAALFYSRAGNRQSATANPAGDGRGESQASSPGAPAGPTQTTPSGSLVPHRLWTAGQTAFFDAQGLAALRQFKSGDPVVIPLPGGTEVRGVINLVQVSADGTTRVGGSLAGNAGSFSLGQDNRGTAGRVLLNSQGLAYLVSTLASGQLEMRELALGRVLCLPLPREKNPPAAAQAEAPPEPPPALQSQPGAAAVLYLDFDGATVTDPAWNDGNTINAAPSALSGSDILAVWRRVREDFAPFNLNITTVESDYTAAAVGSRMRVIITPTADWYPDAGGVAFFDTFSSAGMYGFAPDVPCWVFNLSAEGVAEAISHEVGHTLGLDHDGRISPAEDYYAGHDNWAPIMGSGYGKTITQWSKGEYLGANNDEDDLAIIAGTTPTPLYGATNPTASLPDDFGNTPATAAARPAYGNSFNAQGLIGRGDADVFSFATSGGSANFRVFASTTGRNLSPRLELLDNTGALLQSSVSPWQSYTGLDVYLAAGTYYLRVTGPDVGTPLNDPPVGYTAYGNMGPYSLSGTVYGLALAAPAIVTQPASASARTGESVTFSITASGNPSPTYQWQRLAAAGGAWTDLPAPTSPYAPANVLNVEELTYAMSGDKFRCVATNSQGAVTSDAATLTISGGAPSFASRPLSKTVIPGQPASFTVAADSPDAVTYQWLRNGQPIPDATGTTLSFAAATLADTGYYEVIATSVQGSSSSYFQFKVMPDKLGVIAWGNNEAGQTTVPASLGKVLGISSGTRHLLALKADGTVAAWGETHYGQCNVPAGLSGVVAVAAGGNVSLALKSDGTVIGWGDAAFGGVGPGAAVPAGLNQVVAIAAGSMSGIALKANGKVATWGWIAGTQLPETATDLVAIAGGSNHAVGLKKDGTVIAWGSGSSNQTNVPAGLNNVVAIDAEADFSLALKADGTVVAWGYNNAGQCNVPAGLNNVVAIAAGGDFSLALKADGSVVGWGGNSYGQRTVPAVSGSKVALTAGYYHAAMLVVTDLPVINTPPADSTLNVGRTARLQVAVSSATTPSYQWLRNGVPLANGGAISGANTAALQITNAQTTDSGSYTVEVSNASGTVTSSAATLTVAVPPVLTSRPLSRAVSAGQSTTLTVTPQGAGPFTYVWKHNGQVIAGASGPALTLNNVAAADAGSYWVSVTNADGGVATNLSRLVVDVPNTIVVGWPAYTWDSPPQVPPTPDGVRAVVSGWGNIAVKADGTVLQWDNSGQNFPVPAGLTGVVSAASDQSHVIALKADGTVVIWGTDYLAQQTLPAGLTDVVAVASSLDNGFALKADGTVVGWGPGYALPPAGLYDVVDISAGQNFAAALKADGTVVAWGTNNFGETSVPNDLANVVQISSGRYHTVALKADGTVTSFGALSTFPLLAVPAGLHDIAAVFAGSDFSYALKTDGTIVGWGGNNVMPAIPEGLSSVVSLSVKNRVLAIIRNLAPTIVTPPAARTVPVGGYVTFHVEAQGAVPLAFQWQRNGDTLSDGDGITGATTSTLAIDPVEAGDAGTYTVVVTNAVGNATSAGAALTLKTPPVFTVRPLSRVVSPDQAVTFTAAATAGGVFSYQWRHNGQDIPGATGATLTIASSSASDSGFYEVTATSAEGTNRSVFSLRVTAGSAAHTTLIGWGSSSYSAATPPIDLADPVAFAAGDIHAVALRGDGTVLAWGIANYGATAIPAGLSEVVDVAAGYYHSLALKADGTVVSWGSYSTSPPPVPAGLREVVAISVRGTHNLALKADGTVASWGGPTLPDNLTDVVAIAAGRGFGLALKRDGTVVAWGTNDHNLTSVPAGLTGAVAIAAGDDHALVLKSNGTVVAWGRNDVGQATVPDGLNGVVAIAGGFVHSIALKADGHVVGWGRNNEGQGAGSSAVASVLAISSGSYYNLGLVTAVTPAITGEPQAQTVTSGDAATFAVTVPGPGLTYQWRKDGTPLANGGRISGATGPVLQIIRTVASDAGNYDVVVTNTVTSATSASAALLIKIAPTFLERPASRTAKIGQSVTFSGAVTNAAGVTYVWRRNGQVIPGATGATLTINPVGWANRGYYVVTASNSEASASSVFTLAIDGSEWNTPTQVVQWTSNSSVNTITTLTVLLDAPDTVSVANGSYGTLLLKADGTIVPYGSHSLYLDPLAIGAKPVAISSKGENWVVLRADGTVTSLHPASEPAIAALTGVVQVSAGGWGNYALRADGTVVTWQRDSSTPFTVVPGLTGIVSIAAGDSGQLLALKADGTVVGYGTNSSGEATIPAGLSNVVALSAGSQFSVALKGDGTVVAWGSTDGNRIAVPAGLSGVVDIASNFAHTLALKADGSLVSWGSSYNMVTPFVPSALSGRVVSMSAAPYYDYAVVHKAVLPTVTDPAGQTIPDGDTASFAITASTPVTYQWQIKQSGGSTWSNLTNNSQYSGVLTGTLQVTNVARAQDSGDQFRCVVTNAAGTATSNAATLTVETPASVPGDIDGDGISEVVWRYTPSGLIATWTSSSGYLVLGTEDANWKAVGSGDFDGDGRTDMLWRYGPAGLIASWTSTAGYLTLGTEDANWKIVTTGDFDADGQSDVLWRYVPTGRIASWTSTAGYLNLGTEDANWQAISAGDFDGDGYADVLWRHVPTGRIVTWASGGSYLSIGTEDTNWRYLATGDYDGDGTTDVLWRYVPTGLISSWTSSAGYRALGSEGSGWIAVGN